MGGLARRVSYSKTLRKLFPSVGVLELNPGYYLNDQGGSSKLLPKDVEVQNTFALRGYSSFPFDVANISFHDLPILSKYLKQDQQKTAFAEYPFLKTLISANLIPDTNSKDAVNIVPYVIREFKNPRLPKGKIKVGIVGISEQSPSASSGYIWREPDKVLHEILPKLHKKADLIIVLAYLPIDKVKVLAASVTEIDVVIAAHGQAYQVPVEKVGNASLVISNNETKFLGELRISFNAEGKAVYTNRYISLDSKIPDDPDAAKIVSEARTAIETARQEIIKEPQMK